MKKTSYKILLGLLLGGAFILIMSFIHIQYLEKSEPMIPFEYVPNSVAYKKPTYLQVIKTDDEIKKIKASDIRDAQLAEKGAAIEIGEIGLTVIPREELGSPEYHLKWVGVQKALAKKVNGFRFEPNTLFTKDPIPLQVIKTENEVRGASQQKWLSNRDLLQVGAAVVCPQKGDCYTMAKSTLKREYRKVVSIVDEK